MNSLTDDQIFNEYCKQQCCDNNGGSGYREMIQDSIGYQKYCLEVKFNEIINELKKEKNPIMFIIKSSILKCIWKYGKNKR